MPKGWKSTERNKTVLRRIRSLQKFVFVSNHLNADRNLTKRTIFEKNRAAALAEWRQLGAA